MAAYSRNTTWSASQTLTNTDLNAEFDAVQTAVNTIDTAQIAASAVTTAKMASPNYVYSLVVPLVKDTAVTASNLAGIDENQTNLDFPFEVNVASTLVGITTGCYSATDSGAGTNEALVRQNAADVVGSTTAFASGAVTKTTGLSTSLATSDTLAIRVNSATTTNDGIVGGYVILWLKAVLQT